METLILQLAMSDYLFMGSLIVEYVYRYCHHSPCTYHNQHW